MLDHETNERSRLAESIEVLRTISAERPSIALANGKSAKTADTLHSILVAAQAVFVREGHRGLSMRMVADEAGLAVGNLTYHFATKNDLLRTVLLEQMTKYVEAHLVEAEADLDDPIETFMNVVSFYVRNSRKSHRFFYQLWGYAASGPEANDYVRCLYHPIGRYIFHLLRAANPKLDYDSARRAVLQVFCLEEGYKLFIGLGPDDDMALATAEKDMRHLAREIVFGKTDH